MTARRRLSRLLPALAVALLISVAASACGESEDKLDIVEGEPVELGELQYNVLITRTLNPDDVEDAEYLVNQPAPAPDELYLGVFVEILNKGKEPLTLPSDFTVSDTEGTTYSPIPSESPYALHLGSVLDGEDQAPALDSTAFSGPIEGSLILFKITDESADARPLKLTIPGEDGPAEVELDI